MVEVRPQGQNLDIQEIKRRSLVGIVTLTSRTFLLQVIALVATFILTILLDPAAFGIFFVVTAVVNFLNYFSDIGLAAALIQKKDAPTNLELGTTFTLQQLLVSTAVVIALALSKNVASFYGLGDNGVFLYRSLIISFFLSSLKTIPSVLLERKLDFQKLVLPQIVESVTFYVVAILLALKGYGVVSFAWAALLRGLIGTTMIYIVAPWRPVIIIERQSVRRLIAFGLPYQANSFLALIKDDLLTIFLGKILPFAAIGYIGWAKKWAEVALRLVMDNVIKVTFPTYARLQHETELLARAIQKSIFLLALLTFPLAVGMVFMIRPLIEVVPRYIKWEPALFSYYLFTITAVLATLSSPLVNALNAMGKVKYTFYLMVMWTALTWTLVPLFVAKYDYNGVAMAALLISFTSFTPLLIIRRIVPIIFIKQLVKPAIATLGMTLALVVILLVRLTPQATLAFGIPIGIVTYGVIIYILAGKEIVANFRLLKVSPST